MILNNLVGPELGLARRVTGPALWVCLAVAVLLLAACGETTKASSPERPRVVATTAILADLVSNVGGGRLEIYTLLPPGADIHSFQTTPGDSKEISRASLIFSNGSGLDDFLDPVIRGAMSSQGVRIVTSSGLDLTLDSRDPHLWQNPLFVVEYVERIRDALVKADPERAPDYRSNASRYIERLHELDREIASLLDPVPEERRHLVTFHDAFTHFTARYGWQSSAFTTGDATEVTPGSIVALMERIKSQGIPSVFTEPQLQAGMLGSLAKDVKLELGTIYSDALDGEVDTYIKMMQFNANSLVEHLR